MGRESWVNSDGYYEIPTEAGTLTLPSVTSVLNILNKPALVNWAKKVTAEYAVYNRDLIDQLIERSGPEAAIDHVKKEAGRKSGKAADAGSLAHSIIERLVLGEEITHVDAAAAPYVEAFLRFQSDHVVAFEASEMTVFHPDHGYAGTADAIARIGNRVGILDWKTRQNKTVKQVARYGAYDTERLQIAAYAQAPYALLPNGTVVDKPETNSAAVIMLCTDGYHFTKVDIGLEMEGFMAALALWRNQREPR